MADKLGLALCYSYSCSNGLSRAVHSKSGKLSFEDLAPPEMSSITGQLGIDVL